MAAAWSDINEEKGVLSIFCICPRKASKQKPRRRAGARAVPAWLGPQMVPYFRSGTPDLREKAIVRRIGRAKPTEPTACADSRKFGEHHLREPR